MQVETFECSETASEPIEAGEEAIALIESLGLRGQKALVGTNEKTAQDERSPYREMRRDEQFVYSMLCPEKMTADEYDAAPIPLRVLQVMAHAKSLGLFNSFQIWDKESVAVKDPVLVARVGEEWQSNAKLYILARWGEVLESWPTLLAQAIKIFNEKRKSAFAKIIKTCQAEMASEVTEVPERFDMPQMFVH